MAREGTFGALQDLCLFHLGETCASLASYVQSLFAAPAL